MSLSNVLQNGKLTGVCIKTLTGTLNAGGVQLVDATALAGDVCMVCAVDNAGVPPYGANAGSLSVHASAGVGYDVVSSNVLDATNVRVIVFKQKV